MTQPQFADAIALLKADHRHIDDLFVEFGKTRWPMRRQSVADTLCNTLKIHIALEQEIFFPAFRGHLPDELLDRAQAEDEGAAVLIRLIEHANPREDTHGLRVKSLAEAIRRHIHAKERFIHGLFARCRKAGVDLVALRDAMIERKRELQALGGFTTRPPLRLVAA